MTEAEKFVNLRPLIVVGMKLSKNAIIGYPAGIITGITYGLNPLFAIPLMKDGESVEAILFFRYAIAALLLGLFLALARHGFRVSWRQSAVLMLLGLLFSSSSLLLFEAYRFIPSGLATTLVFLYPVMVALIMAALGKRPSWPVWLSIAATFGGVAIMTGGAGGGSLDLRGILLSVGSALTYALFIVIVNRSRVIADVSDSLLTFYALTVGSFVFLFFMLGSGVDVTAGLGSCLSWLNLLGLAILPTIVSTATLAVATRRIGATKTSVLGVFEPITAIAIGAMVYGEPLTPGIIAGISISVVAVTYMICVTKR